MTQPSQQSPIEENLSEWTVMVYFAADNDLIPAAAADLLDIKAVGSTEQVKVIAQNIVPASGLTARYRLRQGTFLDEDIKLLLGAEDRPESIADFACWAIDNFPARRYMLVLWGHGLGWEGHDPHPIDPKNTTGRKMNSADRILNVGKRRALDRLMRSAPTALKDSQNGDAEAAPERSPDFLESDNLSDALALVKSRINQRAGYGAAHGVEGAEERKIDILGMDICLMAMAEVGYQVRESVDYMVASEEAEPAESWPYASILSDLVETPNMPPDELAVRIARKYILYFQGAGKFITQSICNLNRADDLLKALKGLARVLRESFASHDEQVMYAVMMARSMAQSFYMKEFIDLYHFCEQLQTICKSGGVNAKLGRRKLSDRISVVRAACRKVLNVIRSQKNSQDAEETGGFVYDYGFYGFPLRDSNGVSIYFPCDRIEAGYDQLEFNQPRDKRDVTWNDFLKEFVLGFPQAQSRTARMAGNVTGANLLKGKAGDPNKGKAGDPNKVPSPPSEHLPDSISNDPQGDTGTGKSGRPDYSGTKKL
ncbi:MAG TPA: clostripain-related cysteine peptidase [Pyrinomonadaceae bacterium]|jgi:hypothetical protein|nr:clostripain-related cysteine peptidase [Pyrinomonadaceae bacterium]